MKYAIVAILAAAYILLLADSTFNLRPVPQCEEDQVLIGTGEFTGGRWSSYRCGPAVDDFAVDMPL